MNYKNSVSILFTKVGMILKTFLYLFVIFVIVMAIGLGIIVPLMSPVFVAISESLSYIREVLSLSLEEGSLVAIWGILEEYSRDLGQIFSHFRGEILIVYTTIVVLLYVFSFLHTSLDIAVAKVMDDYMSSKMKSKFVSALVWTIPKNMGYIAFRSFINWLTNILIWVCLIGVIGLLSRGLSVFSATIALGLGIMLYALRFAFLADWVPNIVQGKKCFAALKDSLKIKDKYYFKDKLLSAICFYGIASFIILALSIPTFGLVIIIAMPVLACHERILELVNFYGFKKIKYYKDDNTVVEVGDNE